MKAYHILDCNNLKDIQQETLSWINLKNPAVLKSNSLWNKINTIDLISHTPSLKIFCKSLKLQIRETALTVLNQNTPISLHIDELPVTAKINIPIHNTKDTFNKWYEIPENLLKLTEPYVNKYGKKYYDFVNVDYSSFKLLGEVECTQPIVFNSQLAHTITFGKNCNFPRIVLSCTFFKEPTGYLED